MVEIAAFGEPLVGFYHVKVRGKSYSYFQMTMGGDTSNLVPQLSKLGYSVEYISKLGKDYLEENILKTWEKWNVNHSNVGIDLNHQTGAYFTIFNGGGKHQFIYKRENSAAANYNVEEAKEVKVFHFSGTTRAISKSALEAFFYSAKKCKSKGTLLPYGLNYRKLLWGKDYFSSTANYTIKKYADIVTLNLKEAVVLGFATNHPKETVEETLIYGPQIVALRLGEDSCTIGDRSGKICLWIQPRGIRAINTACAGGDAFNAGVISGALKEMRIEEITNYANLIAPRACRKVGSAEGQPTKVI